MKPHHGLAALAMAVLVVGCGEQSPTAAQLAASELQTNQSESPEFLNPDERYIVRVRDAVVAAQSLDSVISDLTALYGGAPDQIYRNVFSGFVLTGSDILLDQLALDFRVEYVEADQLMRISAIQSNATWGLARIDDRANANDFDYVYTSEGTNVHVYVIDTGLNAGHVEFAGRVGKGHSTVPDAGLVFGGDIDCNGHGTHVAGTVLGASYGVAKNATIHSVRTFTCAPTTLNTFIIAGADWVAGNHVKPAVANLSLGGGASQASDDSVQGLIDLGITAVVAAGNDTVDACGQSPARLPDAITVASTTRSDARSSFSNFGACVDIFAPGSSITSASYLTSGGTQTMSGTSMASPHVAGAVAKLLQRNPTATPALATSSIVSAASNGFVGDVRGSPNLLLYSR